MEQAAGTGPPGTASGERRADATRKWRSAMSSVSEIRSVPARGGRSL